jgi:fucose permease
MEHRRSRTLIILYILFIAFGIAESGVDPLTPIISKEIGTGYDLIGIILFVSFFFLVISNFIAGRLSDRYETKKIIIVALLLIVTGLFVFGIYLTLALFIITMIFARSGLGALDTSTFTYVCQFYGERRSEVFVKLHILWYSGCVIGPSIISILLFFDLNPRYSFIFVAGLFLVISLLFLKIAPSKKIRSDCPEGGEGQKQSFFASIKSPSIIIAAIVLFFYAGAVFGFSIWLTTYFYSFDIQIFIGSALLSAYYLFSIIGLFATNLLMKKFKEIDILTTGYLIGSISILVIAFVPVIYVKLVFLMIQGFALACVFPLVKTIPIDENPGASGTIVGFLNTIQGIGIMAFQPIFGFVAENIGGGATIFVILSGQLIGFLLTAFLFIIKKRKNMSPDKYNLSQ